MKLNRKDGRSVEMAWGLGLEPRFSDSKSDVLPIRRPPKAKRLSRSMPTGALIQKADYTLPSMT
jgi:hypothetical protein